jgi:hypothetical protein
MKKNKRIIWFLSASCLLLAAFSDKPADVIEKKDGGDIAYTRTTVPVSFTPNTAGGFSVLSSYINQRTPDSVQFELLLKQINAVNWHSEQLIGTITDAAFLPREQQTVTFYLLFNNKWRVRVLPNGNCFFRLRDGAPPAGNPVILPFKVRYKNN